MRNKLLIEAVGTFFLCLVALVSPNALPVAALLCALIYMGSPVSLAHYNPAVSLAFRLRGRSSTRALGAYVGVQLAAAVFAAMVAGTLLGHDSEHAKGAVDALSESAFVGFGVSAIVELLCTFALAFIILMVGTSRLTAGNSYFGLAIAVAVLGLSGTFGDFNPTMNPAVSLASSLVGAFAAIFDGLLGTKTFVTETLYLAKVAPRILAEVAVQFVGAALAAWFFRILFPEDR
jgi:aquaporin Z